MAPRPETLRPERVFLIGYRGAGKTTVARLLAERWGWAWVDADVLLEERAGRSIRQIFATEGEEGFREREAAVLADLCQLHQTVIATGGGVILRPANRERLRSAGTVVWLRADAATLWHRLAADDTTSTRRPNLTTGGLAEVQLMLAVREPLYRDTAHFHVETAQQTPDALAAVIANWIAAG